MALVHFSSGIRAQFRLEGIPGGLQSNLLIRLLRAFSSQDLKACQHGNSRVFLGDLSELTHTLGNI